MKKIALLLLCFALAFNVANAQHEKMGKAMQDPAKRVEMQTKRLTKQLSLSADQQVSVSAVLTDHANVIEKIRSGTKPGSDDRKKQVKEARTNADQALKKILTAEQAAKYDKMEAKRKEKMKEKLKEKLDDLED